MPWLSPACFATVATVVSASPWLATERIAAWISCSRRFAGGAVRRRRTLLRVWAVFRKTLFESVAYTVWPPEPRDHLSASAGQFNE